ncbi:tetratricopeptide repeat protein [Chloroflexota bacterium]
MANSWIADQKWRDVKYQDLPEWIRRRVEKLDHHPLKGKSFEYRREPVTGSYQRRLRRPRDTSELHRKGVTCQKLGEHEQAIACFDEAIRVNDLDHTAWHRKGISLNHFGKYSDAIECFETAIHINPRDKFAWNHRALSLCRLGNNRDALTSCNEAIKIDDTYPFAWYNRAIITAYLEDLEDFEKSYSKARQLDPKGLNNQFLAENLPQIEYKELLNKSKGDVKRSVYYCCELCMVHLQIHEMPKALKYALDLRNYANEKIKAMLTSLTEELEFRINGGISVTQELIGRADVILHQVKMGW